MATRLTFCLFTGLLVMGLAACSSDDDSPAATTGESSQPNPDLDSGSTPDTPDGDTTAGDTSQPNPDLDNGPTPGTPGGDTTAIAGLWDGSFAVTDGTNTFYWSIAENGVLTSYDYQQDEGQNATLENCYIEGDAITITPVMDDNYSIAGTSTTITRTDNTLSVVFLEADASDLDEDGNTSEIPTYSWPAVSGLAVADLTACTDG